MPASFQLPFEQPIHEIEAEIRNLDAVEPKTAELAEQIRNLRRQLAETIRARKQAKLSNIRIWWYAQNKI